jgi:hypothetical protein
MGGFTWGGGDKEINRSLGFGTDMDRELVRVD